MYYTKPTKNIVICSILHLSYMSKFILIILFGVISCSGSPGNEAKNTQVTIKDYTAKHSSALLYCKEKGFSESYYFLVDMSIHSGRNRFYVYDFKQGKIIDQNVVTHGSCDQFEENSTMYEKAKFSNRIDSHCTALGKYKVGKRDYSSWGINVKYWLDGLEESNNNARDRVVVLHSWTEVADSEVYPNFTPLSWGCPAVSDNFMRKLDVKLQNTTKPVLLWIIE